MVKYSTSNKGKKVTVLRDELGVKGGGIYCYMPFYNLDEDGYAIFKVGMSLDFEKRTEHYHTYFPNGVWVIDLLQNPPIPRQTRTQKSEEKVSGKDTEKKHYLAIEEYIFKHLESLGAIRIHSTARVRHKNAKNEGQTEWFYCNVDIIHKAFEMAHKKYDGTLHQYQINKKLLGDYTKKQLKNPNHYIGELIFDW